MPILAFRLGRPGEGQHGSWAYEADRGPDAEGLIECPASRLGVSPGTEPKPMHHVAVGCNPGDAAACCGWAIVFVNNSPLDLHQTKEVGSDS